MAGNPEDCRRHPLRCVNQASNGTSPAASQKIRRSRSRLVDAGYQIEASAAVLTRRKAARNSAHLWGTPFCLS